MATKLKYVDVKSDVESLGYTLLTKKNDFVSARSTPLNLQCNSCGDVSQKSYRTIRRKRTTCGKCYQNRSGYFLPYPRFKDKCAEKGLILLTDEKDYSITDNCELNFECPKCERVFSFRKIQLKQRTGNLCRSCTTIKHNAHKQKWDYYSFSKKIKEWGLRPAQGPEVSFGLQEKFSVYCSCGRKYSSIANNILQRQRICRRCSNEKIAKDRSLTYEEIQIKSEELGIRLLSAREEYTEPKQKMRFECPSCGDEFSRRPGYLSRSRPWSNRCRKCTASESAPQRTVEGWLDIDFVRNSRKIIAPQELDIYIPEYSLAIEVNGLYWHGERHIGKDYHLEKTKTCADKGITLVHLFEDEIKFKPDIARSMILSRIGKSEERIFARKCAIKDVSNSRVFLEENHIQGWAPASVHLGLYHKEEIVAITTFGKPRMNKTYDWELIRFCTKKNTSVPGGFSKLFKAFIREYSPRSIISYADKRYSTGELYKKNGFVEKADSKPNYFWVKGYARESRQKYQKHKLGAILENFDPDKTEVENMHSHGFYRIWDCGNKVLVWEAGASPS